jgi:1,4-dihydroxy-2-naphthoate octaprenyltransferase
MYTPLILNICFLSMHIILQFLVTAPRSVAAILRVQANEQQMQAVIIPSQKR